MSVDNLGFYNLITFRISACLHSLAKIKLADSIRLLCIIRMKIFVVCQEHTDVETFFLEVEKAGAIIRRPVSRGTTLFPSQYMWDLWWSQ